MAKHRVVVLGTVGKTITVDDTIPRRVTAIEEALAALQANANGDARQHANLLGLQLGNDHPQYPLSRGRETIRGQWDFAKQIWASLGTAALPGYAFTEVINMGLYGTKIAGDPYFANVVVLLHADGINGGTTFTDSSSYARTISITGTVTTDTGTLKYGTASANNVGNNASYLSFADAAAVRLATGNWCVEFWIRRGAGASVRIGKGYYATTVLPYDLNVTGGGTLSVNGADGAGTTVYNIIGGNALAANTWYHVSVVRNGSTFTLYLDGVSQGTATYAGTLGENVNEWRLGPTGGGVASYLDDFRMTVGQARYTATFTPPTTAMPDAGDAYYESVTVDGVERVRFNGNNDTGNVQLRADNQRLQLGVSQDLSLYHDGTNSVVKNDTGVLRFHLNSATQNALFSPNTDWNLTASNETPNLMSERFVKAIIAGTTAAPTFKGMTYGSAGTRAAPAAAVNGDGIVSLDGNGYDGTAFRTQAFIRGFAMETWVNAAGHGSYWNIGTTQAGVVNARSVLAITQDGHLQILNDNSELQIGAGTGSVPTKTGDLRLYHDGTNSFITNNTGTLIVESTAAPVEFRNLIVRFTNIGGPLFRWVDGDAALNEKVAEWRNNTGVISLAFRDDSELNPINAMTFHRTGTTPTAVRLPQDNEEFTLGVGNDLRLYHDGTNSFIRNDTGDLIFNEGATEVARLNTAGSLIVGTNVSPFARGIWTNGTGNLSGIGAARFSADANGPSIEFTKSRNASLGGNTIVQSGDTLGRWIAYGANGTSYDAAAEVRFNVDGVPGAANDMPGRISLWTTPDGSAALAERFRISEFGGLGIGGATYGTVGQVLTSGGPAAPPVWAAGGGGSFTATQVTVNLPYPATRSHKVNVVDAAITATDKIIVSLAGVAPTQTNDSDTVDSQAMQAYALAGSFDFQISFLTPAAGPLVINYARAA